MDSNIDHTGLIAKTIHCLGKVQGVFYRASTKEKALSLNLAGWVKNQLDGSVLLHAEGDQESIQQLIDWCKQGPPSAIVEKVYVQDSEIEGLNSFDVIH